MKGRRPTLATVDLGALASNYREACRLAGGRAVVAVVKADAYGHGASAVARRLVDEGCGTLAVLSVEEAGELRAAQLRVPILVLGGVHDPEEAQAAARLNLTPVVHTAGQLAWLSRAARDHGASLPVQLEIDTGMRRMGVPLADAAALVERIHAEPALNLDGVYTHLARADEPDPAPTEAQLADFRAWIAEQRGRELELGRIHVANSAALLASEARGDSWLVGDAVRPGLCLYGAAPAPQLASPRLRPVMTLRTRVVIVRHLQAGDGVGYGATYRAAAPHWVATLAVGYADGVPWSAANRGVVWLAGRRCPMVGRVSMDFVTVDTGAEAVEIGEEALLFGGPDGGVSIEAAAAAAGTIPYELLVRVGARVPRVVIG